MPECSITHTEEARQTVKNGWGIIITMIFLSFWLNGMSYRQFTVCSIVEDILFVATTAAAAAVAVEWLQREWFIRIEMDLPCHCVEYDWRLCNCTSCYHETTATHEIRVQPSKCVTVNRWWIQINKTNFKINLNKCMYLRNRISHEAHTRIIQIVIFIVLPEYAARTHILLFDSKLNSRNSNVNMLWFFERLWWCQIMSVDWLTAWFPKLSI